MHALLSFAAEMKSAILQKAQDSVCQPQTRTYGKLMIEFEGQFSPFDDAIVSAISITLKSTSNIAHFVKKHGIVQITLASLESSKDAAYGEPLNMLDLTFEYNECVIRYVI